jgi:N-acyl-D-amino-acid deacylase
MRTLIRDGDVIDGTGAPTRRADVLIEDDHVAEIGAITLAPDQVVDARGMVVTPGFIDVHSHGDFQLPGEPEAQGKVMQGVTTEVIGNCGLGLFPANEKVEEFYGLLAPMLFGDRGAGCARDVAAYRDRLNAKGLSVNAAPLIPHGNVRCLAMSLDERPARPSELTQMKEAVAANMEEGAFGFSTGLVYPPGAFAETEEVIELARVTAQYGGIYATHMRDEGGRLVQSVEETLRIAREAKVSTQISHHKAAGRWNWGKVKKTLRMIDRAREQEGLDVHCDVYPYTAGSTVLSAMILPLWAFEGSQEKTLERLRDPATREKILEGTRERLMKLARMPDAMESWFPKRALVPFMAIGLSRLVVVSSVRNNHEYEGLSIAKIARRRGQGIFDTMLDLLVEEELAVAAIAHMMSEDDVERVMKHPITMIGSDGFPQKEGKPHPRSYGTYPRVLEHYVRERKLFSLETAISKMTSMVARKLGMKDRGELSVGKKADVVIFDAARIHDRATYADPRNFPTGLAHVFVNGRWTVKNGEHTGARGGGVLTRGKS